MADAILHKEYRDKLALLEPAQQMAVIFAMMDYADGEPVELEDPAARMAFAFIKDRIDDDSAKYDAHVTNGKKGGRPKTEQNLTKPNESEQNLTKPNQTEQNLTKPNESEQNLTKPNESEKSISISISKSILNPTDKRESKERKPARAGRAPFVPPTVEEVEAYCRERGNSLSAQGFINYYQSNGWKVGKNPMLDWKAAVRTWEARDGKTVGTPRAAPKKNGVHFSGERKIDYDAILREEQLAIAEQIRAAGGEP